MDKTGRTLRYSQEKCCKIIIAAIVLHNLCIDHSLLTELETSIDESTPDIDYLLEPSEDGILIRGTIKTQFFQ